MSIKSVIRLLPELFHRLRLLKCPAAEIERPRDLRLALLLLAFCFAAGCNHVPSGEPKAAQNPTTTTPISIRTAKGVAIAFTPAGPPQIEIVNHRLNFALTSQEGMIFELVDIPAEGGIAPRQYRGTEFRALILHSGFQEEAATGDAFKETSQLEIIKRGSDSAPATAEFHYVGKIRAGSEILDVQLQCSGLLPAVQKFLTPNRETPSSKSP